MEKRERKLSFVFVQLDSFTFLYVKVHDMLFCSYIGLLHVYFYKQRKKLMRPRLSYREEFSCVHLNFSGTKIEKCMCLKNGYVIICLLSEKRMM